jgi:hypothetical protein
MLSVVKPITLFITLGINGHYYKTFNVHNLFRTIVSYSVCHCQSLHTLSNNCGQGRCLPYEGSTLGVYSLFCPQILDQVGSS